jgi:GNAT superfamily N-acetyltransferase
MKPKSDFDFLTGLRCDGKYEILWDPKDRDSTRQAHVAFNALLREGYYVEPSPETGRFRQIKSYGKFVAERRDKESVADPPMVSDYVADGVYFNMEVSVQMDGMLLISSVASYSAGAIGTDVTIGTASFYLLTEDFLLERRKDDVLWSLDEISAEAMTDGLLSLRKFGDRVLIVDSLRIAPAYRRKGIARSWLDFVTETFCASHSVLYAFPIDTDKSEPAVDAVVSAWKAMGFVPYKRSQVMIRSL